MLTMPTPPACSRPAAAATGTTVDAGPLTAAGRKLRSLAGAALSSLMRGRKLKQMLLPGDVIAPTHLLTTGSGEGEAVQEALVRLLANVVECCAQHAAHARSPLLLPLPACRPGWRQGCRALAGPGDHWRHSAHPRRRPK